MVSGSGALTIDVQGTEVTIFQKEQKDYLSLTDIARYKNPHEPKDVVKNWLRSKNTIEFIGLWEILNNPNFKGVEFDHFKNEAGYNSFTLSPKKWIEATNAIGIISKLQNISLEGQGLYAQLNIILFVKSGKGGHYGIGDYFKNAKGRFS